MAPNIVDGVLINPLQAKKASNASQLIMSEVKKKVDALPETEDLEVKKFNEELKKPFIYRKDVKWDNVIMITILHIAGTYIFLTIPYIQKWYLVLWGWIWGMLAAFGVTGGVHRYWTHRSYKANTPMKIFVTFCYLIAGQNSIYQWVRDHRVHHKYSETDADPHNSNRGVFFSHVGWLMLKKHPEVLRKGKLIDMSDIENDPIARFVERHFILLKLLICFIIPMVVPVLLWNESWYLSISVQIARYMYVLNATWSVNSFAHIYGNKPYDKEIAPVENKYVAYVSLGEGWHNYHHVFPYDYRAAELGGNRFNLTTSWIDMFAKIGWTYDLKVPSSNLIKMTVQKRGDGSYVPPTELSAHNEKPHHC